MKTRTGDLEVQAATTERERMQNHIEALEAECAKLRAREFTLGEAIECVRKAIRALPDEGATESMRFSRAFALETILAQLASHLK